MKDLVFGSWGRTNNHGGSKIFSTPHTVKIDPEYFINININRNFVTCSFDGRLWAYGAGTTYVIFAFKWNEDTSMLEQSGYLNLRGEKIKARGLDWLLTDKSIIYVSDDEPYINTEKLFDGSGRFLFSILRSSITQGSGWDSSTNLAWEKGQDGNDEGWGFFNKNNIPDFELCYASLPAVGDWFITPHFLVRKNFQYSYNDMRLLRPLIPLEFNIYSNGTVQPYYGTDYCKRNVQIVHRNNMLFGRGVNHIGRIFLLPAVFSENGNTLEFYLYICPDYVHNLIDDDWLNSSIIASENASLYAFITDKSDSLNETICSTSDIGKVFVPTEGLWHELNGKIFLDYINSSAVSVCDEGITLFHDDIIDLQSNALEQWIAPSGNISCVSDNLIGCQCDNDLLYTNLARQFSRTIAENKRLPLSAVTYKSSEGQLLRLSIGETSGNRKNLSVNHYASNELNPSITWTDIYKQAVSIKLIGTTNESVIPDDYIDIDGKHFFSNGILCNITRPINDNTSINLTISVNDVKYKVLGQHNSDGTTDMWNPDIIHEAFIDIFSINPETGLFEKNSFSITYPNILPKFNKSDYSSWDLYYYEDLIDFYNNINNTFRYWPKGQRLYRPKRLDFQDGHLGITSIYIEATETDMVANFESQEFFTPIATIEQLATASWNSGSGGLHLLSFSFPHGSLNPLPIGCNSAAYAVFQEKYTNTNFALHLPSLLSCDELANISGFFAGADSFSFYEFYNDNVTLHYIVNNNRNKTAILRSEVFYHIFNFYDELKRSTLS